MAYSFFPSLAVGLVVLLLPNRHGLALVASSQGPVLAVVLHVVLLDFLRRRFVPTPGCFCGFLACCAVPTSFRLPSLVVGLVVVLFPDHLGLVLDACSRGPVLVVAFRVVLLDVRDQDFVRDTGLHTHCASPPSTFVGSGLRFPRRLPPSSRGPASASRSVLVPAWLSCFLAGTGNLALLKRGKATVKVVDAAFSSM